MKHANGLTWCRCSYQKVVHVGATDDGNPVVEIRRVCIHNLQRGMLISETIGSERTSLFQMYFNRALRYSSYSLVSVEDGAMPNFWKKLFCSASAVPESPTLLRRKRCMLCSKPMRLQWRCSGQFRRCYLGEYSHGGARRLGNARLDILIMDDCSIPDSAISGRVFCFHRRWVFENQLRLLGACSWLWLESGINVCVWFQLVVLRSSTPTESVGLGTTSGVAVSSPSPAEGMRSSTIWTCASASGACSVGKSISDD